MADTYEVLFTGELKPGVELEQAVAAFSARFGVQSQKVRGMFESGDEVTIKAGLNQSKALEYRTALERIGLAVRVEPPIDEEQAAQSAQSGVETSPQESRDPFEPPKADLEDATRGDFHEPRSLPASRGGTWLRQGFSMVFANPVGWIVAVVIWIALGFVLNLIPIINFLAAMITSVFMGGLMWGAHEQTNGKSFTIAHLFAGFSKKFGPLLLVGALYMIGLFAIMLGVGAGVGGLLFATSDWSGTAVQSPEAFVMSPLFWIFMLVGFALMIPLVMAYWFAPVLVIVDDISALNAMGLSFRACMKNILPFLVYGLIALFLFILGAIPLFLGLLIVLPAIAASVYTSYRDIFRY